MHIGMHIGEHTVGHTHAYRSAYMIIGIVSLPPPSSHKALAPRQ